MISTPPPEPMGNSKLEIWCRQFLRYVRGTKLRPGVNYDLYQTTDGIVIIPKGSGGSSTSIPASLDRFTFVSARKDYIVCQPFNTTDPTLRVNVAKQPELRLSVVSMLIDGDIWTYTNGPYAGTANEFVRRDATLSGATEKQVIVPRYIAAAAAAGGKPAQTASIIYAMKVNSGTGVVSDVVTGKFPIGSSVDYLEISPRHWATKADQTT